MKEQQWRPPLTTIIKAMKEQVIAGVKGNAIHDCWYSKGFVHFVQHPGSQRCAFMPNFYGGAPRHAGFPRSSERGHIEVRRTDTRRSAGAAHFRARQSAATLKAVIAIVAGFSIAQPVNSAPASPSSLPPVSDAASYAAGANSVKAHELVAAAINMTDSERAVKLLWQATEV